MSVSRFTSVALALVCLTAACRPPRVAPLAGAPAPTRVLPASVGLQGHHKIVFTWELRDGDLVARGDGVARVASPDSVRLDFFLGGGFGGGAAVMIGDSLQAPGPDAARRMVPPRSLLWAALGRLDVPAERDTTVRVDGGVTRADIGAPVRWRVTFRGDTLTRLERVDADRIQEWVERDSGGAVHYRSESARRTLSLVIRSNDAVPAFNAAIWSL